MSGKLRRMSGFLWLRQIAEKVYARRRGLCESCGQFCGEYRQRKVVGGRVFHVCPRCAGAAVPRPRVEANRGASR